MKEASTLDELVENLNGNFVQVPFCNTAECEDTIKEYTENHSSASAGDEQFELTGRAKSLCYPFGESQEKFVQGTKCFACEREATGNCLFGRSY